MLSSDLIEFYKEKGYLIIENFFSKKEVKALQLEVKRLKDEGFLKILLPMEMVKQLLTK